MIVKQRYVRKTNVVWCKETDLSSEVLEKLNTSGYRCIPILDENGEKFIGNAYKVTILEHQIEHDGEDIPNAAKQRVITVILNKAFNKLTLKSREPIVQCGSVPPVCIKKCWQILYDKYIQISSLIFILFSAQILHSKG